MKADRNLARYVQPPLSTARIERQWSAVAERTKGGFAGRRSIFFLGSGVVAAACIVAVLFFVRPFSSKSVAFEGAVLETSGSSSQLLTMADGSRVELAEATRLEFSAVRPDAVRLVLTRGSVDLDVTHVEGRTFTVSAAGVDVVVRGTRFRVALSESPRAELTVSVERGRVAAVRHGSGEPSREIGAGETWSTVVAAHETAARGAAAPSAEEPTPAEPATEASPSAGEPGVSVEAGNRFSELVKARKFGDAYASLGPHGFARELERADAKRLLELADAARFSGHVREAITPLDRLRRKFRSDRRAALAAFELGRLRMDSLGDPSGAAEAFADAIALAPSGPVREDAQARQVQALEAMGDTARCAQARDAYLARFPNGIHATSIRGRCGGK